MKIRNRLVSNSSSSSFLIYGVYFDDEELYDLLDNRETTKLGLEAIPDPSEISYGCYLGASWDSVKDDETGAQFKSRVSDAIIERLSQIKSTIDPAAEDFRTYEAAWYNG